MDRIQQAQDFIGGRPTTKAKDAAVKLQSTIGLGGMYGHSWADIAGAMFGQAQSFGFAKGIMNTLVSNYSPEILKNLSPEEADVLFRDFGNTQNIFKVMGERIDLANKMVKLDADAQIRTLTLQEKRYNQMTQPSPEYAQYKLALEMNKLKMELIDKKMAIQERSEKIMTERSQQLLTKLQAGIATTGQRINSAAAFTKMWMELNGTLAPVKLAESKRTIQADFDKNVAVEFEKDKGLMSYVLNFLQSPGVKQASSMDIAKNNLKTWLATNKVGEDMAKQINAWVTTFSIPLEQDPTKFAPVRDAAVNLIKEYIASGDPNKYASDLNSYSDAYVSAQRSKDAGKAKKALDDFTRLSQLAYFPNTQRLWATYHTQKSSIDQQVAESQRAIAGNPEIQFAMNDAYTALQEQIPMAEYIRQVIIPKGFEFASLSEQGGLTTVGEDNIKAEKARQKADIQKQQALMQATQQQPVPPGYVPAAQPGQLVPASTAPVGTAPAPQVAAASPAPMGRLPVPNTPPAIPQMANATQPAMGG